jgi:hypothetical protein
MPAPASRVELGGKKRGKPGDTDPMLQHPLYKELEAIGRNDTSLQPLVLEKYKHLLESPEVQRRALASTSTQPLAALAREALRDAVKALPKGHRRTVGEAVLCAKPRYEDQIVERRIELLEEPPNPISRHMWRYYRKLALKAIFNYLMRPTTEALLPRQAVAPRKPPFLHINTPDEDRALDFIHFMERATDLHYAGLAVLFSRDLQYFLARKTISISDLIETVHYSKDGLMRYIFECHTALIGTWLSTNLDASLTHDDWSGNTIKGLFGMIDDATPIGLHSWQSDEEIESAHSPMEKQSRYQTFAQGAHASHWIPWYSKHCMGKSSRESALVSLVALSGAIESTIVQSSVAPYFRLKYDRTHGKSRLLAQKNLALYYSKIDDLAPLAGDLSLRQRADAYFDLQSPLLTDRGEKWYDGRIEVV